MVRLVIASLFCLNLLTAGAQSSLHQFTAVTINGDTITLSKYIGKKLLLVNTASYCSYTPQYATLEELYKAYKQFGFEILGFPCNDFGAQEPGKDSTIVSFCVTNYGVTFPMMSKIAIAAADTSPVYKWLQKKSRNGVSEARVDWNFNKFLVDECGNWKAHYTSTLSPTSNVIKSWVLSADCEVAEMPEESTGSIFRLRNANPSGQVIHISVSPDITNENCTIRLMNLQGQTLYEEHGNLRDQLNLDISGLAEGIYFLEAQSAQRQQAIKFVISR